MLIGLTAPGVAAWLVWHELRQLAELRVTELRLGFFRDGRQVCAAPLKEVYASTNALLLGAKTLRFRLAVMKADGGEPMFDMDELNRAVLSRLPPQNLVTDQALAWIAFKRRPLVFKLLMAALLVAGMFVSFYPIRG